MNSNVFVVGAQKAGTTSIFNYILKTGAFSAPKIKEPQFFALNDEIYENCKDSYMRLFVGDMPKIDASTMYLACKKAPKRIKDTFGENVKIIICQRDQASRAVSAYHHLKRKGALVERRSFRDICLSIAGHVEGGDVIKAEDLAILRANDGGSISPDYFSLDYFSYIDTGSVSISCKNKSFLDDPFQPFRYFANGSYKDHSSQWIEEFGVESVMIIDFEDMIGDRLKDTIERVFNFLGLEISGEIFDLTEREKNSAFYPKGEGGGAEKFYQLSLLARKIGIPSSIRRKFSKFIRVLIFKNSNSSIVNEDTCLAKSVLDHGK